VKATLTLNLYVLRDVLYHELEMRSVAGDDFALCVQAINTAKNELARVGVRTVTFPLEAIDRVEFDNT
jgi:hypothetical protein